MSIASRRNVVWFMAMLLFTVVPFCQAGPLTQSFIQARSYLEKVEANTFPLDVVPSPLAVVKRHIAKNKLKDLLCLATYVMTEAEPGSAAATEATVIFALASKRILNSSLFNRASHLWFFKMAVKAFRPGEINRNFLRAVTGLTEVNMAQARQILKAVGAETMTTGELWGKLLPAALSLATYECFSIVPEYQKMYGAYSSNPFVKITMEEPGTGTLISRLRSVAKVVMEDLRALGVIKVCR